MSIFRRHLMARYHQSKLNPKDIISGYATSSVTFLDVTVGAGEFEVEVDMEGRTSLKEAFYNKSALTRLECKIDTSAVTSMSYMFYNCTKLTSLDLGNFDTSKVTSMSSMFYNCTKLTSLDLSNFDTSAVTSMSYMFYNCTKLTSLDLSNFDTSAVTSMSSMFYNCTKLTSITGTISGIKVSLSLSDCPLTNESAMVFINGLAEVTTAQTITFSATTYATLTEEQIAVATAKGWTVASA